MKTMMRTRKKTRRIGYTFELLEELWEEDVELVGVSMDLDHRIVYFHIYHEDFDEVQTVEGQPGQITQPGRTTKASPVALYKMSLPELDKE